MISVCFLFKIPLPRGGLVLPLSFPQALSTELRVHWRGGRARSAQTGLRWSPGPMNSFFKRNDLSLTHGASPACQLLPQLNGGRSNLKGGGSDGDPTGCSLPLSSVRGILQARILE